MQPHYLNVDQEQTRAINNDQYRRSEMWSDIVVRWLSAQSKLLGCYTLDEVFSGALGVEPKDVSKGEEQRMVSVLRTLGFANSKNKVTFLRDRKKFWLKAWLTPATGPWVNEGVETPVLKVDDPYSPHPTPLVLNSAQKRW